MYPLSGHMESKSRQVGERSIRTDPVSNASTTTRSHEPKSIKDHISLLTDDVRKQQSKERNSSSFMSSSCRSKSYQKRFHSTPERLRQRENSKRDDNQICSQKQVLVTKTEYIEANVKRQGSLNEQDNEQDIEQEIEQEQIFNQYIKISLPDISAQRILHHKTENENENELAIRVEATKEKETVSAEAKVDYCLSESKEITNVDLTKGFSEEDNIAESLGDAEYKENPIGKCHSPKHDIAPKDNLYFNSTWVLWSHEISDEDYSIGSYRIVWETDNMVDFLNHVNEYSEDEWSTKMFFFMRKGITPRYEDPKNIRGGSWSFRVNKNYCYTSWISLCIQCMGECLIEDWNEMKKINGISLSPKNNTTTVRIWNEISTGILNLQHQVPNIDQNKAIFRPN
jgi:hypothetical protein